MNTSIDVHISFNTIHCMVQSSSLYPANFYSLIWIWFTEKWQTLERPVWLAAMRFCGARQGEGWLKWQNWWKRRGNCKEESFATSLWLEWWQRECFLVRHVVWQVAMPEQASEHGRSLVRKHTDMAIAKVCGFFCWGRKGFSPQFTVKDALLREWLERVGDCTMDLRRLVALGALHSRALLLTWLAGVWQTDLETG